MLAITDPEVTDLHVVADRRLEGLAALKLKTMYEGYPDQLLFDSYEIG
jgi:hypothetical protein